MRFVLPLENTCQATPASTGGTMIGKLIIQRWAVVGTVVAPDQAPESVLSDSREHSNRFLAAGSENPFPNFGTLSCEPIERSDPNLHLRGDSLPADALSAKCGNPPSIHDSLRPTEAFSLGSRVP